jgi:hypothetical protein
MTFVAFQVTADFTSFGNIHDKSLAPRRLVELSSPIVGAKRMAKVRKSMRPANAPSAVEPQDDGHRDSVLHQIEIVASTRISAPACLFV